MTSYSLLTSYAGQSLIQGFDFISAKDPSTGFVSYQNYSSAVAQGLVSLNSNNQVTLTADTTNKYNPDGSEGGRPSVRLESIASYNEVLVIGDFAHMPGSTCGAWPAFWMYGPDWPIDGEIDIIEGANMAYQNLISAHTSSGCSLPSQGSWTGGQELTDCSVTDGCNYVPPSSDTSSYGDSFNAIGGGVYAMLWSASALQVWHFPRGSIPQDITSKTPAPSGWGTPQALFGGSSCDVSEHFSDMTIVLDLDFCGDYAGNTWGTGTCSGYATTCETWVGNNPSKLKDLYWEVNYIDVYKPTTATSSPSAHKPSTAAQTSIPPRASTSSAGSGRVAPARSISTGASSVTAGFHGALSAAAASSKVASASASASPIADGNPASIDDFAYLGCFSSTSGYSSFTLSGTNNRMTLEECTSLCSSSKYAGVVNTQCYCANSLDAGTSTVADRSSCNTPCPGNSAEYCGASSAGFRSLYLNNKAVNSTAPPPAPALAGDVASSSVLDGPDTRPASSVPHGGATTKAFGAVTFISTIAYTTVCSTNPAHLMIVTTTVTYCPIDPSDPSVPQSTITQSCNGCGVDGQNEITLTIPLALVSSPASPQPTPADAANSTTAAGTAKWTPGAGPTYSIPVQASATKLRGWNVVMTVVGCVYIAIFLT